MMGTDIDLDRILLAAAAVGVILVVVALLARRLRPTAMAAAGEAGAPLVEIGQRSLDMRHRVVVVRYRQTDHLVILGGAQPVLAGHHPLRLQDSAAFEGRQADDMVLARCPTSAGLGAVVVALVSAAPPAHAQSIALDLGRGRFLHQPTRSRSWR